MTQRSSAYFDGVGEKAADLESTLSALTELERRPHQMTDGPHVRAHNQVALIRLPVISRECRFGIECVYLAGRAVHEKKHGVLRFHRELRRTRGEWIRRLLRSGSVRMPLEEAITAEEVDQSKHGKAGSHVQQKVTTISQHRSTSVGINKLVHVQNHTAQLLQRATIAALVPEKAEHPRGFRFGRFASECNPPCVRDLVFRFIARFAYQAIGKIARLPVHEIAIEKR